MKKRSFPVVALVAAAMLLGIILTACPNPTISGENQAPSASFPPTGYQVSGAGTAAVNGDYIRDGDFMSFPKYSQSGGSYFLFNLYDVGEVNRYWQLNTPLPATTPPFPALNTVPYYGPTPNVSSAPEGEWDNGTGSLPKPTVLRMPISGDKTNIGGMLSGHYTFSDPEGDADASTFQWYQGTEFTAGTAITGATFINYTTVLADNGKWLRVQVTPVDEHGAAGTPIMSDPVLVGST